MDLFVAAAVLSSALMHAGWNAVLRFRGDRIALMALLTAASGLVALPGLLVVDVPRAEVWPWIVVSMAFHLGYNVFLASAYAHGELGRIYPLARGAAPLLTLGASLVLFGDELSAGAVSGVVILAGGIAALSFEGGPAAFRAAPRGVAYALITSLFIAGYTLSDGIGARISGDPHAYTLWLFALNGLPLITWLTIRRGREAGTLIAANWKPGLLAGVLSLGAYWIAIWGFTQAPIALVAALRETSVIFAVLIGVVFLGERFRPTRILALAVVLCGLAVMRL